MSIWRIVTKGWFNNDQYINIDDLSIYLERQLDQATDGEVKLFINHLLNQLVLAQMSKGDK